MNFCGLILAAGGSSRLGRPKQLVQAGKQTLLEKAVESALEANLNAVQLVLGARYDQLKTTIEHFPLTIIYNKQWQDGIGSSISAGMESVIQHGYFDGVLIMLCDQVHVNPAHLNTLVAAFNTEQKPIIATAYGGQLGVPALFDRKYFPLLQNLSGDVGAKKIISQHPTDVHAIAFEQAIMDIDTADDLKKAGLA